MAMDFGKLNFAVGFNRTSAFPLDANSYFEDYNEAVEAVAGAAEVGSADSAYYIGQIIIINDKNEKTKKGLGLYQITGTAGAGTLTKFGQATSADELGERLTAVEGQISTINGKLVAATQLADGLMSKEDKAKLDLIADNAQVNTIEGIQLDGVDLTPGEGKIVNVAIADTYLKKADAQSTYVAKEEGKGLSTNDYDAAAKAIVDGVEGKLEQKVDKVEGKGLSTNDYDATAVAEVAKIKNKAETAVVEGIDSRVTELEGKISGVTGAMHFKGVLAELPADLSSYVAGDVVIVDKKEYVCAEGAEGVKEWHELGDEGSHLTKDDAAKTYKTIASYNTEKATLEQNIQAAADAAAAEKERAEGIEGALQTAINGKASSETVTALSGKVDAIEKDYLKAADKTELSNAIGEKADQTSLDATNEAATALKGKVDAIEKDYLKGSDKTALEEAIGAKASQDDLDAANGKITALEGKVGKAAAGEEAATGLYKDIADEVAARQTLAGRVAANETNIGALQTNVGTADDQAEAEGSLFARIKKLNEDLTAGLAAAGKIDKITVNGEEVTIEDKTAKITLPAAFIDGLKEGEDSLVVTAGKLELAKVSTDKLVQGNNTLVLNGGNANE